MLDIGFKIVELEKVKQNAWNLVGNVYRDNIINDKSSDELASYQKIIDGAKQVMSNLKLYSKNDIDNYQKIVETQHEIIKLFEIKINNINT
jgi:hypothetical protein